MIRIDTQSIDNHFEIYIDESGIMKLCIIDKADFSNIQEIDLGIIHPIELQNRGAEMIMLSREIMKGESK